MRVSWAGRVSECVHARRKAGAGAGAGGGGNALTVPTAPAQNVVIWNLKMRGNQTRKKGRPVLPFYVFVFFFL